MIESLKRHWICIVLLALCLTRLWLMPLVSSFWVDEMATRFVVSHGESDPSLRIAPQVGASVYYALPRAAEQLVSLPEEVTYRLPSVLAMGLALAVIARLAARLIHPAAAWFAVFTCLLLRGFNYQAADARPYALGTLVTSLALLFLVRWFDSARWLDAAWFILSAALVWRVHLVFWPAYVLFALYAAARLYERRTTVPARDVLLVFAAIGLAIVPVYLDARALLREAADHVVVPRPSLADLSASLKVPFLTSVFTAIVLVAGWRRWPRIGTGSVASLVLVVGWWLSQPLCLFGFSWITGASVFVTRYLFLSLPGVALMATTLIALYLPERHWRAYGIGAGVAVLLVMGQWTRPWPQHHNSDWRRAAGAVNELATDGSVPVICPSAFIEARPPVWRPNYPVNSFLYSPLLVYRIRGTVVPFPFEESEQAEQAAAMLAEGRLAGAGRFVIYGGDRAAHYWRDWFRARPEFRHWSVRSLGPFGDVDVVYFRRPL